MTTRKADIILLFVAICWGCSYWSMKVCIGEMSPFSMVFCRFSIAFIAVVLVFCQKLRQTSKKIAFYAAILGAVSFCIFLTLLIGLKSTTASNAGFINATTIVMVPLIHAGITKRLPSSKIIFASLCAFCGVALMTLTDSLMLSLADIYVAIGALFYAIYIIVADAFAKKVDSLLLGIWQLGFTAIYAFVFMLFEGSPSLPVTEFGWISLFVMALPCTAFGFVAQTFAQRYTPPEHASMLFALEPVSSAVFSFFLLGEQLMPRAYVGAAIILAAVLVASTDKSN